MKKRPTNPDDRIGRLAARHHGLVTRARARACGLTDRQIELRVRAGRWERLGRGVFRIAGVPETDAQRAYAAVLMAGPHTVACGLTALHLVGVGSAPQTPSLCAPPSGSARTPGAAVRRSPLHALDRTRVGPIPITAPARALLEAAAIVPSGVLEGLLDDALDLKRTTASGVLAAIRRSRTGGGRTGAPVLRAALAPWLEGISPGSPGEARLLRRIDALGLPTPTCQHRVELPGGRSAVLDLAWPVALIGLEYDGARWHNPRHLANDERREAALVALGWWIGRVDRHDLAPSSTRLDELLHDRLTGRSAA